MLLPDFIRARHEEIIRQFAAFAKTLMPPGVEMSDAELRDHAKELLSAIVEDMRLSQSPAERHRKSHLRGGARRVPRTPRFGARTV
jgi:hypothetical protein